MTYLFLLLTLFSSFNDCHKQLVRSERYEQAIAMEKLCKPNSDFLYHKAIAHWKVKNYEMADMAIHRGLSNGDLPERYRVTLELMESEASARDAENKMLDIATDMDVLERRLRLAQGGKQTQDLQREVVRKLDEEIKKLEDQVQQANATVGGGQQKSQAPSGDSKIMNGAGPGEVENKKMVMTPDVWGKMPPKEKVKALEAVNRQLPPHIREAAEGFSKALQKGGKP